MRDNDPTLTDHERMVLTALRKWAHRDSPVAADCARILAQGFALPGEDERTLVDALWLYRNGTTVKKPHAA